MHENSRERKAKPRLPSKKCTTTKPKWSTTGTFTNQKTEEETKQQGKIGYSGTNAREKNTKPYSTLDRSNHGILYRLFLVLIAISL